MSEDLIDRPVSHDDRVARVVDAFRAQFGRAPEGIAEAPGRVNLIGEHVDYNDGLVLPFAIDRSVLCAWGRAEGSAIAGVGDQTFEIDAGGFNTFRSMQEGQWIVDMGMAPNATPLLHHDWTDYPTGVLWSFVSAGHAPWGIDLMVSGDVPQGAGLSSSAALEVAIAGAFRDAFGLAIDDVALAQLCQRAENEYVGVQSGIMDQFASTLARRDHALLVDCRSLDYRHVLIPLADAGLTVVIANSAVQRELVSSAYNERRRECDEAVALLRERLGRDVRSLRDVTEDEVERAELPDLLQRRARHVVSEIARVAAAVDALDGGDFAMFGDLMHESHLSLRNDYEVSSEQLDLLVGLSTAQDYVAGARLTGAGFGGCTVNLVRADAVDAFARDVIAPYRARTGLPAVMYVTAPQDGLRTFVPPSS